MGDGTPLPSFVGEPEQVECRRHPRGVCHLSVDSLNPENKVSLFVRYIDRKTGDWETVIKKQACISLRTAAGRPRYTQSEGGPRPPLT